MNFAQPQVFAQADLLVSTTEETRLTALESAIRREFELTTGDFALAFRNLSKPTESLFLAATEPFHAASTMKTPVMMEVYKQAVSGRLCLKDQVLVKNEFRSIVDGSTYCLHENDDSDQELYQWIGKHKSVRELVDHMIIRSSNLATNLLIEKVDARRISQTMRQLGARDTQILRGVEDPKAFERGLNNTTTAFDLMLIYERLAQGEVISHRACDEMILTLLDQTDRRVIPARLPATAKVAHKTGCIAGCQHDSGIVYLANGKKYVLVLLSKNLRDTEKGVETLTKVSELVYQFMVGY